MALVERDSVTPLAPVIMDTVIGGTVSWSDGTMTEDSCVTHPDMTTTQPHELTITSTVHSLSRAVSSPFGVGHTCEPAQTVTRSLPMAIIDTAARKDPISDNAKNSAAVSDPVVDWLVDPVLADCGTTSFRGSPFLVGSHPSVSW